MYKRGMSKVTYSITPSPPFAYSRSRRSGAAAAARGNRIADGLPLENARGRGGGDNQRASGLQRPHLFLFFSGQLRGLSVACMRNAQSTGQRGRSRTAGLLMPGTCECVHACMQHTKLLRQLHRWRPRSRRCS